MAFVDGLIVLGILGFFAFFVVNRLIVKYPGLKEWLVPFFSNPFNKPSKSIGVGIEKRQQVWHEDRNIM